jgi:putative transposase
MALPQKTAAFKSRISGMILTLNERSHDVKRSKFTEQQIAFASKQAELGTPVEEVCRKMGNSAGLIGTISFKIRRLFE